MNRRKAENEKAIKALARKGWSRRRVARELGLDRATVGRYWPEAASNAAISTAGSEVKGGSSNAAISTLGSEAVGEANEAISIAGSNVAARPSLSAQRCYLDFVCDHQFRPVINR